MGRLRPLTTLWLPLLLLAAATAAAQEPWLHIYPKAPQGYRGIPLGDLDISFTEASLQTGQTTIPLQDIDRFSVATNVCRIDIRTILDRYPQEMGPDYAGAPITEIVSKKVYLDANLSFNGRGLWPDVETTVKIRGRGNSTWGADKKPYRLKFPEKTKLGNIHKAKNLVLLANEVDPALMRNFCAYKFGELIAMPYINRILPVDVYLNGLYKGSYMLTEKVGINNGSVDLPKADEPNSILLELDINGELDINDLDEDIRFDDQTFGFPVIVKDPDAPADPADCETWAAKWQADYQAMARAIASGNEEEIFSLIDLDTLVRYVMVFDMACNQEIDHPRSVYLHKTDGGKWLFGPCWDFDWCFGTGPIYRKGLTPEQGGQLDRFPSWQNPLLSTGAYGTYGGGEFFLALVRTQAFQTRFKEIWDDFYTNRRQDFFTAFDDYTHTLMPSAYNQAEQTGPPSEFTQQAAQLRSWIENRFDYINSDTYNGLREN